ncbi:cytochrome P450 [Streptomyces sp. NPDC059010]|uniref:cytochrome P450 n=1 Tax=Streptomyces sp. NPDC059010 TaxID=3346695 RepID=UPI00369B1D04
MTTAHGAAGAGGSAAAGETAGTDRVVATGGSGSAAAVASAAEPGTGVGLDLTRPRAFVTGELDPYFAELRRDRPLAWHEPPTADRQGFWVAGRHADVAALARDTTRLSSAHGNMLETLLDGGDPGGGRMLVVSDPPRHTALRGLMKSEFMPAALESLAERIRRVARDLWIRAALDGHCDVAADIAAKIPLAAICDLLGVPETDRAYVGERTTAALGSDLATPVQDASRLAQAEILLYFSRLARNEPSAMLRVLAEGSLDGAPLTRDELVLNCYSLILGGDVTTRLSIVGGVAALADDPALWEGLRDGEVEIGPTAEEVLRWTTPVVHLARTAVAEIDLHGRRIRPGDVVTLWPRSANRDEREFADPGRFDPARRPNRHLTFGFGPHFCLGAHLARIEVAAVLEGMRYAVDQITPDGPPQPVYSAFVAGYSALPVRLTPSVDALRSAPGRAG